MLTSLYDENQSSQKATLNATLILANANSKTTTRELFQVLVTVTHKNCR